MDPHVKAFIEMLIRNDVLKFGEFKLKSGRISPYFMNFGSINRGDTLKALAVAYTETLIKSIIDFDMIFGPAYKGIPLVASVACMLDENYQVEIPFGYNRKEPKDHGEGGVLIGFPPEGRRVVIIDDVLTAGTAARDTIKLLRDAGATTVAIIIAFDRCEYDNNGKSPIKELEAEGIKVLSVANVYDLKEWIAGQDSSEHVIRIMDEYLATYGQQENHRATEP